MTRLPPRRSGPCGPTLRGSTRSRTVAPPLAALLFAVGLAAAPAWAQSDAGSDAGSNAGGAATPASEAGSSETGSRFFEDLDDLPLMGGLQEMEEAGLAFDKPGGRIGEVYAEGSVPAERVRRFYSETLPQLGWQPAGEGRFVREGEQLSLQVSEAQGTTTLRLSLSPLE